MTDIFFCFAVIIVEWLHFSIVSVGGVYRHYLN